jgi:hypothetical protein
MALKTKSLTIERKGRDEGKTYLLTEMPSMQAYKWAYRAFGAMTKAGLEIPQNIADMGMAGVLAMGLKAILGCDFREAEPLLDDLTACVTRIEDAVPAGRPLVASDIEEPQTIATLHSGVLELHTGFSVAAYLLKIWEAAGKRVEDHLQNTQTSTSGSPP